MFFFTSKYFFSGKPLFLTPLIDAGNISQAQKLSYVHPEDLGLKEKVESFAGYFTVGNPKCNSNLFFWFFPAKVHYFFTSLFFGVLFKGFVHSFALSFLLYLSSRLTFGNFHITSFKRVIKNSNTSLVKL